MINLNNLMNLGMTRLRAILLYELQAVLSVRCRKLCLTQSISKEELQANVKVSLSLLIVHFLLRIKILRFGGKGGP